MTMIKKRFLSQYVKMNFNKKQKGKQEFVLSCINKTDIKLPRYNGLTDKYLKPYFKNQEKRKNLLSLGLVAFYLILLLYINENNEILESKKFLATSFFSPQQGKSHQSAKLSDKENNQNLQNSQFSYIKSHEQNKNYLYTKLPPLLKSNQYFANIYIKQKNLLEKFNKKHILSSATLENLTNKNYFLYKNLKPLTKEELQSTFQVIKQKVDNNIRKNQYVTKQKSEIKNENMKEKQKEKKLSESRSEECISDKKSESNYDNDFQDEQQEEEVVDEKSQNYEAKNSIEEASNYNSDFDN